MWIRTVSFLGLCIGIFFGLFFVHSADAQAVCPIQTGRPYKISTSPSVYYISEDCKKTPIKNPDVYFSHFTSWKDVEVVSKATLNGISDHPLSFLPWGPRKVFLNGSLVKTVTDPKVYLVLGDTLFHIANENAMWNFGLQPDWVEDVDLSVVNQRKIAPIDLRTTSDLPGGVMVLIGTSPSVYRVELVQNGVLFGQKQETLQDVDKAYRRDRIFHLNSEVLFVTNSQSFSDQTSPPSFSGLRPMGGNNVVTPPPPPPSPTTALSLSYGSVATQIPGVAFGVPIVISNGGDTDITSITVSTTVPTNFVYTSSSSDTVFTCPNNSPAGTNCSVTIATLVSGTSTTVTFGVTPTSTTEGTTTFRAEITAYTATVTDSNLSNNSANLDVVVDGSPNLSITLTPNVTTSTPSTTIIFAALYGNTGSIMSTGTVVTTTVPTGTIFVSASSTAGWSCANGSVAETSCEYSIPSLGINATGSVNFAVRSLGNYVNTVTTTMSISDNGVYGSDSNLSNNTATATSTVIDYLVALSDEFSDSSLDASWTAINPSYFTASVSTGSLHMTPQVDIPWFDNGTSGGYYKAVNSSYFKVSTLVRARSDSTPDFSQAANGFFHLGGINIRDANVAQVNYIHVAVGDPDDVDGAGNGAPNATETKTTVNGVTVYTTQAIASDYNSAPDTRGDSQVRLCRVGATYYIYRRPTSGGSWSLIQTYTRSDIPAAVLSGPVAYVAGGSPTFRASFDYVRYSAAVATVSDCTTD